MREHYATTTADGTEKVHGRKFYFCHKCSAPFSEWTNDWNNRVVFPCEFIQRAEIAEEVRGMLGITLDSREDWTPITDGLLIYRADVLSIIEGKK